MSQTGLSKLDRPGTCLLDTSQTETFGAPWRHATSADLISWQDLPVAIPAESNIWSFNGTSWFDEDNTSGLGISENPPYLAFYTGYFPTTGVQDQRLAYSLDTGATFTELSGNSIISKTQEAPHGITGGLEICDQKVFWYSKD
jgi:sucrose-6-phosphate hydrolase SacC (GH32 family)